MITSNCSPYVWPGLFQKEKFHAKTSHMLTLICNHFDLQVSDLRSKNRKREITKPRQIACYLMNQYCNITLGAIGREINRDHTTVIHAIKVVKAEMQTDKKYTYEIAKIRSKLGV